MIKKINKVMEVDEPVGIKRNVIKLKKVRKVNESGSLAKNRSERKNKSKKLKSKESSKVGTPRSKGIKSRKRSGSVHSNESSKSIEAIYLQRLRKPKDKGEIIHKSTVRTPKNDSIMSLSIQMSLNQLNMIAHTSNRNLESLK
jgi:hypothetical protein